MHPNQVLNDQRYLENNESVGIGKITLQIAHADREKFIRLAQESRKRAKKEAGVK